MNYALTTCFLISSFVSPTQLSCTDDLFLSELIRFAYTADVEKSKATICFKLRKVFIEAMVWREKLHIKKEDIQQSRRRTGECLRDGRLRRWKAMIMNRYNRIPQTAQDITETGKEIRLQGRCNIKL